MFSERGDGTVVPRGHLVPHSPKGQTHHGHCDLSVGKAHHTDIWEKTQQTLNAKMSKIKGIQSLLSFSCAVKIQNLLSVQWCPNSHILREINQGRGTQGSSGFLKMGKSLVSSYNYRRMIPQ